MLKDDQSIIFYTEQVYLYSSCPEVEGLSLFTYLHFRLYFATVIMVAHFLQSVSPQLVLGGELVYHRGRAEEGGILTLAGQYSGLN